MKVATYKEIGTWWNTNDVAEANCLLDMKDKMESIMAKVEDK